MTILLLITKYILRTSDYTFGSSMVLCTTMVNETIQYSSSNVAKPVYLVLLDASYLIYRIEI